MKHYRSVTCRYFCLPSPSLLKNNCPAKNKHVLANICRFIFVFQRSCRVCSTDFSSAPLPNSHSVIHKWQNRPFFSFQVECLRKCRPDESLRESPLKIKGHWLLNSIQLSGYCLASSKSKKVVWNTGSHTSSRNSWKILLFKNFSLQLFCWPQGTTSSSYQQQNGQKKYTINKNYLE